MREFFWRRRNARLTARLSSVIETSERVRKSYQPKAPRVVIDTSFIEKSAAADVIHPRDQAYADENYADDAYEGDVLAKNSYDEFEPEAPYAAGRHAADSGHDAPTYSSGDDEAQGTEDFDLLREAVEQLEQADRREAEAREREERALEDAQTQRERSDQLERALAGEQKARGEAQREIATLREAYYKLELTGGGGERSQDAVILQKLKSQQERVARLEVLVHQEQASRSMAEKLAVEARQRAAELQNKIDQLAEERQDDEGKRREEAALRAASELRERVARLEASSAANERVRQDAEARAKRAERAAEEAERRLKTMPDRSDEIDALAGQLQQARQRADGAEKRRTEAERRAHELDEQVLRLEADLEGEIISRQSAEDERDRIELEFKDAGGRLEELSELAQRLEETEGYLAKSRRQESDLSRQLSEAKRRAEQAEAATASAKSAHRAALLRVEQAELAAADVARELTELRVSAESRVVPAPRTDTEPADQRIAELEREVFDLRRQEGDAARQLVKVKKRSEQFEAAVGDEQTARQEAEKRLEMAERAAEDAARELATFKAEAAKREAELKARIEKARSVDSGSEVPAARVTSSIVEPPSKVPSVMRGAFGAAQPPVTVLPSPEPASRLQDQGHGEDSAREHGTSKSKQNRRDQRVASRMPVTLWRQGMSQSVGCTLIDKSASGARVELPQTKFGESSSVVGVGDKLTLTFTTAQERTTVSCMIVWMDGRQCGLKYCGPFNTEVIKSRKPAPRGKSILAR